MENMTAEGDGLALVVPGTPGRAEAARLVRQALIRAGRPPWREMELELYPGGGESLLLARPRRETRAYIDLRALRWLLERSGAM